MLFRLTPTYIIHLVILNIIKLYDICLRPNFTQFLKVPKTIACTFHNVVLRRVITMTAVTEVVPEHECCCAGMWHRL